MAALPSRAGNKWASGAEISIFPNPFEDVVNLRFEFTEVAGNLSIQVVNIFGQSVYTGNLGQNWTGNVEMNLEDMPAGIYLIQVTEGNSQVTKTIVKS